MPGLIPFLRKKLDEITVEFLAAPMNYGTVYEAQFLAYLECLEEAKGSDSSRVWSEFLDICKKAAEEGKPPQGYSSRLHKRQELVDALRAFQRRFETPRRTKFVSPAPAQKAPDASSTDTKPLGLFDILEE